MLSQVADLHSNWTGSLLYLHGNRSEIDNKDRKVEAKPPCMYFYVHVFLHVNSCVANVHSVSGLPQKKGVIPTCCQNYTEIKYVKDVSCVGLLRSVNLASNVLTVAIELPVGARLHQFWEKWEALGASPKVLLCELPEECLSSLREQLSIG